MDDLEAFIRKARNGDKESFGVLYKLYYTKIFRYCRIHLPNEHVADDACQEVFIRAWKSLPRFVIKDDGTFQAYLFRIARNYIIDLSRKKKEIPLDAIGEISKEENLIEGLEKKENIEKVRNALAKLSDVERQIIILRYFEELSHADIAKIIKIKEGALRVRTVRLLKKMKELIKR